MRISITARHFKAPDRLRKYAEVELYRLEKFYDGIVDCTIVMDYVKANHSKHSVEIHLNVYGQTMQVSEMSEDMYKSIDKAVSKLERKLQKYKARIRGHTHKKAIDYVEAGDNGFYEEE